METFLKAVNALPGKRGTLSEVLIEIGRIDHDLGRCLITHDLVCLAKQAAAEGKVKITFCPKARVDFLEPKVPQ